MVQAFVFSLQEYTVDQQRTQWFSLYHSLQHYKYHTYLMCKDEVRACFTLLHLVLSCVEWLQSQNGFASKMMFTKGIVHP